MTRRTPGISSLLALLVLLGSLVFGASRPVQAATASLELHKRVCHNGPPKVDIFIECHQFPPDQTVRFKLDNRLPRAVGSNGNLTFTGLTGGVHTVTETEGPPLEFVDLRVWCSVTGSGVPAKEIATDGPAFQVTLQVGKLTICDVYSIPEDLAGSGTARLEMHKRICENGEPVNDIFLECHQFAPDQEVRFRVDSGASKAVDDDGDAVFSDLTPGNHRVTETEGPPLEFVRLRVWCSVLGSGVPAAEVATDGPRFRVMLRAGDHMVCDSYSIPIDLSG